MIKITTGDILNDKSEAIVNTVNCAGVMGKGIALQFKLKYPDNYRFYKKACDQGKLIIGKVLVWKLDTPHNPKYIINFPTKRHWKTSSKIEDIEKGLSSLVSEVRNLKIKSIAIPPLGSGLGGLDWEKVKPIILLTCSELSNTDVTLYEPNFNPGISIAVNTTKPRLTLVKALLIKLLEIYQALGYSYSQLEVQKLMYFMDVLLDKKLNLEFSKSKYGPYTNKLNHLLQNMENHYIRGYGDRSQKAEIRLLETAVSEADNFFSKHTEYLNKIACIEKLVDGFETPFGMELLSTVHWVATHECNKDAGHDEIASQIHTWNERKKQLFKLSHIIVAYNHLREQNWI